MNRTLIISLTALSLLGSAVAAKSSSTSMAGNSMAGRMSMTKVNVNSASAADLQKLPGVSAKLAAEIIKMRPYKNEADFVKKVKGIGPKNVKKMEAYLAF